MHNQTAENASLQSASGFSLEEHRQFLLRLVRNGGPNASEYEPLLREIDLVAVAVQRGIITVGEVRAVWESLGDATTSTKTMQGFVWLKPHGYAGDFEVIDRIYQCWRSPHIDLVKWDDFFHAQAAPRAVRNRKSYFHSWLQRWTDNNGTEAIQVLNLGSGPGRDILEYFQKAAYSHVRFECVDHEAKAVTYAKDLCAGFLDQVEFHHGNALRHRPSRQPHLIWISGLVDYLGDRTASRFLRQLWLMLPAGGELVIGNFSPKNSMRAFMELLGGWVLHHRSKSELAMLAHGAGIPKAAVRIDSEAEGVNLFLHAHKNGEKL